MSLRSIAGRCSFLMVLIGLLGASATGVPHHFSDLLYQEAVAAGKTVEYYGYAGTIITSAPASAWRWRAVSLSSINM